MANVFVDSTGEGGLGNLQVLRKLIVISGKYGSSSTCKRGATGGAGPIGPHGPKGFRGDIGPSGGAGFKGDR